MAEGKSPVPPDSPAEPRIHKLTRRELLKLALSAGGIAAGAGIGGRLWHLRAGQGFRPRLAGSPPLPAGVGSVEPAHTVMAPDLKKIELPPGLSVNPAFCARAQAEGGGLVWVGRSRGDVTAYSLNPEGWALWRLCDGHRSRDQIAREFAQQTRRPAAEAEEFLQALQHKGLVVQGGYLVASRNFPEGPQPTRQPDNQTL